MNTGLLHNLTFWSGVTAWVLAQMIKVVLNTARTHQFDFRFLYSPGGMPSSHTAAACAVATSVAVLEGLGSTIFAVTLLIAFIVMYDAQGVRRAAGQQARILNQMFEALRTHHRLQAHTLAELLGHTPLEVFAGSLLGIAVALLIHAYAV
ncbi:MAG: divergent PAP2 family protein [Verrucomicrobia bacterium]|nr:MAG: divergent PAP2 family protein [Verrucomicrobiota bacterium]